VSIELDHGELPVSGRRRFHNWQCYEVISAEADKHRAGCEHRCGSRFDCTRQGKRIAVAQKYVTQIDGMHVIQRIDASRLGA
jgi:hypothetical protein